MDGKDKNIPQIPLVPSTKHSVTYVYIIGPLTYFRFPGFLQLREIQCTISNQCLILCRPSSVMAAVCSACVGSAGRAVSALWCFPSQKRAQERSTWCNALQPPVVTGLSDTCHQLAVSCHQVNISEGCCQCVNNGSIQNSVVILL